MVTVREKRQTRQNSTERAKSAERAQAVWIGRKAQRASSGMDKPADGALRRLLAAGAKSARGRNVSGAQRRTAQRARGIPRHGIDRLIGALGEAFVRSRGIPLAEHARGAEAVRVRGRNDSAHPNRIVP